MIHNVMNAPNRRPVHTHETVSTIECGFGLDTDSGWASGASGASDACGASSMTLASGNSTRVVSVSDLRCEILFGVNEG